jgi:penicillin-binding protein 2
MSAIEPARQGDPRVPVSPQLAWRVALMGGVALALFAVIFFRLWYLQVLTGERYVQQANANRARNLPIPAPRGQILDSEGRSLVSSRTTNAVSIVPSALPPAGHPRLRLYHRLGSLLGMSPARIQGLVVRGRTAVPYASVQIKTDAGPGVRTVLAERQNDYPGVVQEPVSIRTYPDGQLAAQVLGYVGQISESELKLRPFHGVPQGTVVGQEGLEYYYDRYLRGRTGIQRVEVNAAGYPVPSTLAPTLPTAGYSLETSLNLGLQKEGENALLEGIERARAGGKPAPAGAFVAMDPRDGRVLALGSYPTFNPNKFAKPLTQAEYAALQGKGGGEEEVPAPLINRAVSGTYPTGSTFKPITAMGALEGGVITPEMGLGGGQCIYVSTEAFCNAGKADYGAVALVEALKVSSDTYFFETGELANSHGNVIQNMAHELGIGEQTGIDLPSEITGLVPDRAWRAKVAAEELACERRRHVESCGISDGRQWSVGDNMHLAVGQGDLLTSPLQMAVAYSTLANAFMHGGNGVVVRPHIGLDIADSQGRLVQGLGSPPVRHVHFNDEYLNDVMEGIHEAASQPGGTSADVWSGWDQEQHPVYGKTGTAEHIGKENQSWYMCYIGDPNRPILIAVTVEQAGWGAETAAPIARLIASQWFGKSKQFVSGTSKTL